MAPPNIAKKVIAKRASSPDLRSSTIYTKRAKIPKLSPQGIQVPKKPNATPLLAGPSKILSALPWPPETPKSSHPQSSKTSLPRPQRWQVPRPPVRILQRPTISRPTPHSSAEVVHAEQSFVNPRRAPPVPRAVVRLPVVSAYFSRVDAGGRLNPEIRGDPEPCLDPRTRMHHEQAEERRGGSDSGKTTLSHIVRTADIMQVLITATNQAIDPPTANETTETETSDSRRKLEPASRLPRASKKPLLVNSDAKAPRVQTFRGFKEQMDREKEEYDLVLSRQRRRDQRVLRWLEGIPREVEEEVNEGLLCVE